MSKKTILAGLSVAGMALMAVGCATPVGNSNLNTNTRNSNTAIVTNTNTAPVANDNANRSVSRADYERDKDRYSREAKESGSKIGQGADDLWLWTKTRASLLTEDDLRDSTINVDVDNGIVTLRGSVANADQKARAEAVAKDIEGVKTVKNSLVISKTATMMNPNDKATNTHKT